MIQNSVFEYLWGVEPQLLRNYEGYTTEEIAEITGTKPATVRTQLTRARQKLADLRRICEGKIG